MFVIFSSVPAREGVTQFLLSFVDAVRSAGESVVAMTPMGVCGKDEDVTAYEGIRLIDLGPDVFGRVRRVSHAIERLNPQRVVFVDEARGSLAVLSRLAGSIPCSMVCHDPTPHPTRVDEGIRGVISAKAIERQRETSFCLASEYILLSQSSAKTFSRVHPGLANRVYVMPLCPHPPVGVGGILPPELEQVDLSGGFYLFFGRIDKYKGLDRLLRAYSARGRSMPLVIAGSGELSDEESRLVACNCMVHLVNRYVGDSDLVWLFEHCGAVVLPYVEASQSGVLAMAYNYGKPVIVSDLPGLTEFVSDGETGIVCRDEVELSGALDALGDMDKVVGMRPAIISYLHTRLDWGVTVRKWLDCNQVVRL